MREGRFGGDGAVVTLEPSNPSSVCGERKRTRHITRDGFVPIKQAHIQGVVVGKRFKVHPRGQCVGIGDVIRKPDLENGAGVGGRERTGVKLARFDVQRIGDFARRRSFQRARARRIAASIWSSVQMAFVVSPNNSGRMRSLGKE